MKRIHIVGCSPRSGTTLITEMMIACFDIDRYTQHEDQITKSPPGRGRVYLTKAPKDTMLIGPVLKAMDDLTVIYMIRDPRDLIVSRHGEAPDEYWASLKFWKAYTPFGRELMNHPRFIAIKYEDLVADANAVQQMIMERIPYLNKRYDFTDYHKHHTASEKASKALGGVRAVSGSSIGNWKSHLPRVKQQIKLHGSITADLVEYGYEDSADWERILDDVPDQEFKTHLPEFFDDEELKTRSHIPAVGRLKIKLDHSDWVLALKHPK